MKLARFLAAILFVGACLVCALILAGAFAHVAWNCLHFGWSTCLPTYPIIH